MADVAASTSAAPDAPLADVGTSQHNAADASNATQSDLPTYDDALLIRRKGKVIKPMRPDVTERDLLLDKLHTEINKHSARMKDITAVLEQKRSSREGSAGEQDISKRLQALKTDFSRVLRQKQHIRDESLDLNRTRDETRAQLRAIREKVRSTTPEQLEQKIADMEMRINHETLAPQEERKLQEALARAIADRPLVAEQAALTARMTQLSAAQDAITKRLQQCDGALADIKQQEAREQAAKEAIRSAAATSIEDVPALRVEKQECWEIINACRDKIKEVRADYDKRFQDFFAQDRNYRAYMRVLSKQQYEERQREREAREQERREEEGLPSGGGGGAGEAAEGKGRGVEGYNAQLYASEVYTCDQTLAYLRGFLSPAAESTKAAAKVVEAPGPGMRLMKKKGVEDDAELAGLFAVSSGKGKKGKGARKEEAAAAGAVKRTQKLLHSMDSLKTFLDLGVPVPQSTAEVPDTITAVEAAKQKLLDKREAAKQRALRPAADQNGHTNGPDANSAKVVDASAAEAATSSGAARDDAATPTDQDEARDGAAQGVAAIAAVAAVPAVEQELGAEADAAPQSQHADAAPTLPEPQAELAAPPPASESEPQPQPTEVAAVEPTRDAADAATPVQQPEQDAGAAADTHPQTGVSSATKDVGVELSVDQLTALIAVRLHVA